MKQTAGIHHITAIVGHPQENIDFYGGVLGMRLVKQTVNFDNPGTYHLYFGNDSGQPGTIITFFPWVGAYQGSIGDGQVGVTSYAIPVGAMPFWVNRLASHSIQFKKAVRFGEQVLQFDDPHGLHLEFVERESGEVNAWTSGGVTPDVAINGFAGATLYSTQPEATARTLTEVMGLSRTAQEGDYVRFTSPAAIGNTVDVKMVTGVVGTMGVGTVHHIAWRAEDDADHKAWQEHVASLGEQVTEIKDRQYFNAIYFREEGDILFEIATDPPGFAHDESLETMGQQLMLPAQYEQFRSRIEDRLNPISVPKGGVEL